MTANGPVYMMRVMLVTRFQKQWLYLPWWPWLYWLFLYAKRFIYTML